MLHFWQRRRRKRSRVAPARHFGLGWQAPARCLEDKSLEVVGACLIRAWYRAAWSAESKSRVEDLLDWLEGNGYGDRHFLGRRGSEQTRPSSWRSVPFCEEGFLEAEA